MTSLVRSVVLGLALLAGLLPVAAPAQQAAEPSSATDNLEHVATVKYDRVRGSSWWATDSDFVTFTIPEAWTLPDRQITANLRIPDAYQPVAGEVRTFNLMGSHTNGMWVTDITDPTAAVVVAHWDCGVTQADVFTFRQEQADGSLRQYAAYTQDATNGGTRASRCFTDLADRGTPVAANARGTFIAEVTDPYRPSTVSYLPMAKGTHQTTVHPSGRYIYNSAAVVDVDPERIGSIEVYDVSDPAAPALVDELMLQTGLDSHDMSFSADGARLFVAALTHSFVIDTEDPASPQIVARVFDPAVNIHHDAHRVTVEGPAGPRDFLLIGDELGGATGTGTCPGGGIHVYDITGPLEMAPVKVGAFFIPEVRATAADGADPLATCTAHVISPVPGTTLLSVAWYNAGVRVLDYAGLAGIGPAGVSVGVMGTSTPAGIVEVGHSRFTDSSLWSAQILDVEEDGSFYIYGGDMDRHLDIWRFDPAAEGSSDGGEWLSPRAALDRARAVRGPASLLGSGYRPFCLLGA